MTLDMELECVETPYGAFHCYREDLITDQLKQHGAYMRNELAMILSFVREGDTVLDIGAHIGTYSIPIGRQIGRNGRLYAFEASPENATLLKNNVELNQLNNVVMPFFAAVTDKVDTYELKVREGNTGDSYLVIHRGGEPSKTIPCVVLDEWIENMHIDRDIDFIKIDTQGMEVHVLRSCQKLISRSKPIIYAEIHRPSLRRYGHTVSDVEVFLERYGYHFFKNFGPRKSHTGEYKLGRLLSLSQAGSFYDVLAIHPSSTRYPKCSAGLILPHIWLTIERARLFRSRIKNQARRMFRILANR